MNTTSTTRISRVMGISVCMATASLIPQPASASPPTPREVARHVHNRVSGLFFKIARTLEGAPKERRDMDRERYEREQAYEEEYLYEEGYEREPSRPRDTGIRNPGYYDREDYVAPPPPVSRSQGRPEEYRNGVQNDGRGDTRRISPDSGGPDVSMKNRTGDDRQGESRTSAATAPRTSPGTASKTDSGMSEKRSSGSDKSSAASGIEEKKAQYATPVPNKSGFVYPPGSKQTSENMLDVRGLEPGQKARDPRTGDVFLVP